MVIFGVALRVRGDELEVLDHRDAREQAPSLPVTRSIIGLGCASLELDLALAKIGLDAVERAEEIVVPEGAAEFAVGDRLEADLLLLVDDLLDLAVLDLP